MKRQNSTTSSEDDHSRTSIDSNNHRTNVYPLEMISSSPTALTTPPYNRNNIGRRKKLSSYSNSSAEKRNNNNDNDRTNRMQTQRRQMQQQPPLLISSPGGGIIGSISSSVNSPTTSTTHDTLLHTPATAKPNTIVHFTTQDTSKTRKKKAPPPLHHLLSTLHYKLHYYRKKLATLSSRQKVVLCTLLIVWKFIQAWLIVKGFVWLSGGSSGAGGSSGSSAVGEGVVRVGQSMEQRLKLEEELTVEIELLSRVQQQEEDRLEERLWMDRDEVGNGGGGEEEWIEEERSDVDDVAIGSEKRILYMLTVTCSAPQQEQQQELSSLAVKESLSTHQQRRDGIATNENDSSRNLDSGRDATAATNIDSILSTLSTNIQTMIDHPEGYTVDVYWILGCAWSDYVGDSMQSSSSSVTDASEQQSAGRLNLDEKVSQHWNEYIARQLPDGVGLQVWGDAMPLDYSPNNISQDGVDNSRENRGKDELDHFLARRGVIGSGGGGTRGLSRTNLQRGQTQQQIQHRRLEEESETAAVRIVNVIQHHHQGRMTSQLDKQSKTGTKNGEGGHSAATLSPSIDKFMKQHRFVVRDKLDYYDVFLSFGASLQRYHPQSSNSITGPLGELVSVNGTNIEFCTKNLYRDTKISCSERVEYLMKRYDITRIAAMISVLKEKDCICTADEGRVGDLEAIKPSQSLERITGDHIHTFLSMSSELNELPDGQHIIPGLVSVDAVPSVAAESINTLGTQQYRVDSSPCCGSDSMELTVEMKGAAAINADEWQMMKVETVNAADGDKEKAKEEAQQSQPSSFKWIAVERRRGDAATTPTFKFYEDGWMLTKDQLLRLDYGSNRGKFLPPFTNENVVKSSIRRTGLVSPLFDSADDGGLCLHRAVSLDPNRFSRQLIRHPVSHPSKYEPRGVKELLRLFHKAKDEM